MTGLADIIVIDGTDIGTTYGVGICDGGYAQLACWPAMKSVTEHDWPEEDGVEPDLLNPHLEAKDSFTMDMYALDWSVAVGLIDMLKTRPLHEVHFIEMGVTVQLRFVKMSDFNLNGGLATFNVEFAFDGKFTDSTEFVPDGDTGSGSVSVPACGLLLDGTDMSGWGILPLDGISQALAYMPQFKDAMKFGSAAMDGQHYDSAVTDGGDAEAVPKLAARDVSIPLLARASGTYTFWTAWKSLLSAFTASGGRTLTWDGTEHRCYYKSMSIDTLCRCKDSTIWCKFSLTLRLYEGK